MKKWLTLLPMAMLLLATNLAHAYDKPSVIRYTVPGYIPGKASPTQVLHTYLWEQQLLQKEFEKDGITIERSLTKAAGPGCNEAFANGRADFAQYGDFPLILGKAGGLKTKLVLAVEQGASSYIIARSELGITSVKQLKGKRVGLTKGTASQSSFLKILERHGMTINDVKLVNVNATDGSAALVAGAIDALVSSFDRPLVSQGVAKDVYTNLREPLNTKYRSGLAVSEEFARKYPEITKRFVKTYIRAMYWGSQEGNREAINQLRVKLGSNYSFARADYEGLPLKDRFNPLLNKANSDSYKDLVKFAVDNKLIRNGFNVDEWIDSSYAEAALKELGLQNYWTR